MKVCPHGMPTPASCFDCMEDGNLPAPPPVEPEAIDFEFTAKFEGQCPVCNLPTMEGRRLVKTTRGRYVHPRCAP